MDEVSPMDAALRRSIDARTASLQLTHPGADFGVLSELPDLFHLLWRIGFDLDVDPPLRHYAASLAMYVVSRVDFLPEASGSNLAFLDDLAVAGGGIRVLIDELGASWVGQHWRHDSPLGEILDAAEGAAAEHLPDKVRERVDGYLRRS